MNRSTIIVALLGVAASTTNTIVVNASSIPAPSPATASDWADVADEAWGNAEGGGGRSLEDLSDMQRRRLSTSSPTGSPTTDTIYAGDTPVLNPDGVGDPVPTTISKKIVITGLPTSRRLSSSVQRDLASVSCSSLDIDSVAYKAQLDSQYCTQLEADPNIDTCELDNLVLTCATTGPTPAPTGITLTVAFDLDLVVKCSATPCDADAAEAAVVGATAVAQNTSNGIATTDGTTIPTTSGSTISVPAGDITITEEVTSNAEKFSEWYPLWSDTDAKTCSNDGEYPLYMENKSFFYDTLAKCCEHYYGYVNGDCIVNGGGNPASIEGYGEFYKSNDANGEEPYCVRNCPEDTTGIENCGGIAANWQVSIGLYETAEECCDAFGYGWDKEKCAYFSENGDLDGFVYVGSGKFFVPFSWEGCLLDHADNEDKYANGVQEFTTQAECCKKVFHYLDEDTEVDIAGCCEGGTAC